MIGIKLVIALLIFTGLYLLQLFLNKSIFVKFINITFLFVLSSLVYFSFESYKGWPSKDKIAKGYLIAVQIIQPTEQSPGGIYAWVIPSEDKEVKLIDKWITYRFDIKPAPRSYYLPYTKQANKAFADAQQKMKEGNIVLIDGEGEPGDGEDGLADKKTKQVKSQSNTGDATDYKVPHLIILSPDTILKK